MKYLPILAISTTGALAAPQSSHSTIQSAVQALPVDIHGADKSAFPAIPANLPADQKAFLAKYQPLADKAVNMLSPLNEATFSKAGFCYSDFPCMSVERAAVATIGDKEEVTRDQISAIIDQLTSSESATFGQATTDGILSGLKTSASGATLQVIAPSGNMDTSLLAGMVFDTFKLQSDDPSTNAIRAVQAKTDGKERPFVALCLYPDGVDANQAYNFCIGNEIDGTPTSLNPGEKRVKRFSFEGIVGIACGFLQIPILCQETGS